MNLNKPIYAGFSVLELSKLHMFDFHYNTIKKRYGDKAVLLFTDTDSLCYYIQTEDIYKDMAEDGELYDFSDYATDHPLHSDHNKKVLGKMKDETAGVAIRVSVGLRPKMYSIDCPHGKGKKKAKGVKTAVVEQDLRHQHYMDVLRDSIRMHNNMNTFRSAGHEMFTVDVTKISLSAYDDKRYILADGVTSLAYGHYKIPTL